MRDMIIGTVVFILSLFTIYWLIPAGISSRGEVANIALLAAFWPYVLTVILLTLGALLAIQGGAASYRSSSSKIKTNSLHDDAPVTRTGRIPMLTAVALLAPYYYFSLHFGLLLSSIVAFVAYALLAGERSYLTVALWGIATPTLITLFFTAIAQVLIPLGPLAPFFQ